MGRTDAFADVLDREVCAGRRIDAQRRPGLEVVINASELRTGSAFRFGSQESGTWRVGKIPDNDVPLATAVAASAAYPLFLPALDRVWTFEARRGGHGRGLREARGAGGPRRARAREEES